MLPVGSLPASPREIRCVLRTLQFLCTCAIKPVFSKHTKAVAQGQSIRLPPQTHLFQEIKEMWCWCMHNTAQTKKPLSARVATLTTYHTASYFITEDKRKHGWPVFQSGWNAKCRTQTQYDTLIYSLSHFCALRPMNILKDKRMAPRAEGF